MTRRSGIVTSSASGCGVVLRAQLDRYLGRLEMPEREAVVDIYRALMNQAAVTTRAPTGAPLTGPEDPRASRAQLVSDELRSLFAMADRLLGQEPARCRLRSDRPTLGAGDGRGVRRHHYRQDEGVRAEPEPCSARRAGLARRHGGGRRCAAGAIERPARAGSRSATCSRTRASSSSRSTASGPTRSKAAEAWLKFHGPRQFPRPRTPG